MSARLDTNQPDAPARSFAGPTKAFQPGQGAGQGPSQGISWSVYADGASRRPARRSTACVGKQGSVCGAGYQFARRRTRPHTVIVHRCRRGPPAEQRPGADPDAAAAQRKRWNATYARLRRRRLAGRRRRQEHDPDGDTAWFRIRTAIGWWSGTPSRLTEFRRR